MYKFTQKQILKAIKKSGGYRVSLQEIKNKKCIKKAKEKFIKDFQKNPEKYKGTLPEEWIKLNLNRLIEQDKCKKEEMGLISLAEDGWRFFDPLWKKAWCEFRKDVRTIIVAVIISIIT
ncbi:MAG: hypothetical protein ACOCRX_11705, partial [Candidatus Woesearchaeota archaeon]